LAARFIKDELKTIQAFLMAAETVEKKNKLLKVWVEQIRDLSYDIEDCLDEFMVHVGRQNLSQQLLKLKHRHRIAVQIRDLKSRVEEVSNRNVRYKLIEPNSDKLDSYMEEDVRNLSAKNIDESELVGFDNPKEDLIKLINIHANHGIHQVISVVGMGGLGKTTLVRKVFHSIDIVENFSSRAWITVSQSFDKKELLKELIKQLFGDGSSKEHSRELENNKVSGLQSKKVDGLMDVLMQGLEDKRYFVVLDDLWKIDDWNWIKTTAFPKSNKKGSRILVTTRDASLAKLCASIAGSFHSLVYCLEPLQDHHAKELLLKKTNRSHQALKIGEAEHIFDMILKKCAGLPLAIVTIGGVLGTTHLEEWAKLYQQLPSELESNLSLEAMKKVVTLSYTHLPSHLKPCFLYLSIFPEDFKIKRRCLVNRWIAEGFVVAKIGMTVEDVGNSYFDDLINRSMIQPYKFCKRGLVQTCLVHDIMRDITVSICLEENFVFFPMEYGTGIVPDSVRHLSIDGRQESELSFDLSRVRSLSVFYKPIEPLASLCSPQLRMLRVLDLEHCHHRITQQDIRNIGLFHHLKYISVRKGSYIYALPKSIGRLRGLQTLDIRGSHMTKLPVEVTKLQNLRILRCSSISVYKYYKPSIYLPKESLVKLPLLLKNYGNRDKRAEVVADLYNGFSSCWSRSSGIRVPKGIGALKQLRVLESVDIGRSTNTAVQDLRELTRLRKLAVAGVSRRNVNKLSEALQNLPSLRSLRVDSKLDKPLPLDQLYLASSPPPLHCLKLTGQLEEIPNWIGKLVSLVKVQLILTKLKDVELLRMLGKLPNLVCLRLILDAYIVEELVLHTRTFPKLGILQLGHLNELRKVTFEEGTSPKLEKIIIEDCHSDLKICGISSLQSLEEILHFTRRKLVKVDRPHQNVETHGSHPLLQAEQSQSCHDMRDAETSMRTKVETGESSQSISKPDGPGIHLSLQGPNWKRSHSWPPTTSAG